MQAVSTTAIAQPRLHTSLLVFVKTAARHTKNKSALPTVVHSPIYACSGKRSVELVAIILTIILEAVQVRLQF